MAFKIYGSKSSRSMRFTPCLLTVKAVLRLAAFLPPIKCDARCIYRCIEWNLYGGLCSQTAITGTCVPCSSLVHYFPFSSHPLQQSLPPHISHLNLDKKRKCESASGPWIFRVSCHIWHTTKFNVNLARNVCRISTGVNVPRYSNYKSYTFLFCYIDCWAFVNSMPFCMHNTHTNTSVNRVRIS